MHTGPAARSARTMSEETPPVSGTMRGFSPGRSKPIRPSAETKSSDALVLSSGM